MGLVTAEESGGKSTRMTIQTSFKIANQNLFEAASPRRFVLEMLLGYVKSQLIYVAAKLAIPDLLHDTPLRFQQIAEQIEAEPIALYRLLHGLVNIGILYETPEGKFGLTESGCYLVSGKSDGLREIAILQGEEAFRAWGNLLYSVQTGQPAFKQVFGSEFFEYLAQNPQTQQRFDIFMSTTSLLAARAFYQAYDFSTFRQVIDVGGGNGRLLATILQSNHQLSGLLFDITCSTVQDTGYLADKNLTERCQIIRGDFFEDVPMGGDVYILSQIIHDWDDERALKILQNCRRAMKDSSRLLLFELIMPSQVVAPCSAVERDLVMLVLTGGRERTETEFCNLLEAAGFELNRIIPTIHSRSIIEAVPS